MRGGIVRRRIGTDGSGKDGGSDGSSGSGSGTRVLVIDNTTAFI